MKVKIGTAIVVIWEDMFTKDEWQHDEFEIEPSIQNSIGWLIKSTDDHIVIAQNVSDDGAYFACLVIQKPCIREIRKVVCDVKKNKKR